MYSASERPSSTLDADRYALMSSRTEERRWVRERDSKMVDLRRANSRRWSESVERWRERFWSLVAEEVRVTSESRRRESEEMVVSR
jgi:hypothetical protein